MQLEQEVSRAVAQHCPGVLGSQQLAIQFDGVFAHQVKEDLAPAGGVEIARVGFRGHSRHDEDVDKRGGEQHRVGACPEHEGAPLPRECAQHAKGFGRDEEEGEEMGPDQKQVRGAVHEPPPRARRRDRPVQGVERYGGEQHDQGVGAHALVVEDVHGRQREKQHRNQPCAGREKGASERIYHGYGE